MMKFISAFNLRDVGCFKKPGKVLLKIRDLHLAMLHLNLHVALKVRLQFQLVVSVIRPATRAASMFLTNLLLCTSLAPAHCCALYRLIHLTHPPFYSS
jgi:hypothetical protein